VSTPAKNHRAFTPNARLKNSFAQTNLALKFLRRRRPPAAFDQTIGPTFAGPAKHAAPAAASRSDKHLTVETFA
jgi:hypothetical protein